ncbi:hypothetical protein MSAN_00735300 [Mycena sanguinolenta]|uniref:Uncharacterized protein n=1 Tax=Mycena sanguinolenta TaxID=230812 RepID=A0A8H6Z636_9AGAR|nr:hypothetical protein MSAN_00735300 [Mycena sanguinolenta]
MDANSAAWSQVPRFAGLYTFKKSASTSKAKNSGDKATEDASEQLKPSKASAGVELKMREMKMTTDPPPRYTPLGLNHKTVSAVGEHDDQDSSSGLSSPPPQLKEDESEEEVSDLELEEKKATGASGKQADKGEVQPVLVKVIGFGTATQQVAVPGVRIHQSQSASGSVVYHTNLRELLPAVVENHSPMKAITGGRFMRRGLVQNSDDDEPASYMDVGSVDQHMKKAKIRSLEFGPAELLDVKPTTEGFYTADIFFDPGSAALAAKPAPEPPVAQAAAVTKLTGSGSDKPLEIAQARANENPFNNAEAMDAFHAFLRQTAEVQLETYPRATANDMQEALLQYNAYKGVLKIFKPWNAKKGYDVPMSSKSFAGQHFTLRQIQDAIKVPTSSVNLLVKYFEMERLRETPEALAWFKSGGVDNQDKYNSMAPADWKKELNANKEKADRKAEKKAERKERAEQKHRKRYREESSSEGSREGSESEPDGQRDRKGKGRGRPEEEEEL